MSKPVTSFERFVSDDGRLSFPFIVKQQKPFKETDRPRYRATLIFKPEDDITRLEARWANVLKELGWDENLPRIFHPCFYDLDDETAEKYGYPKGGKILRAWNYSKPRVFGNTAVEGTNTPEEFNYPVSTPDEEQTSLFKFAEKFYPGAIVRINLSFFAWKVAAGAGVSAHIHAMQFRRDCEDSDRFRAPSAPTGFTV